MSYLVLARKYRPSTFADIVGQEHVNRTLANAIKLGRVHHAFLFTGARGVGKTTTARVLARALNCEKGPTAEPCGTCAACTEIASGASPDVLEIDGASNTGVDNVRELRENVRYLPSRGRFKLYIIDEVHMLSQAAFNALLKTLEEPPAHVKFIFATTEPHKIPVTILSRCQRFDFRRVSVQQLSEHLRKILALEKVELSASALAAIVREAQGSVRDSLSLLDQVLSYAGEHPDDAAVAQALGIVERQTIFDLCEAVLTRDATRLLSLVAEVDARGHDLADVAGLLVEHFRDLMVVKVSPAPAEALLERSPGELNALTAQAEKVSRPDLHRYFSLMVSIAEDVARSQFARVSLEMGLLRLLEVEPAASLGELLTRLDALTGQGGGGGAGGPGGGAGAGSAASHATKAKAAPAGAAPVSRAGAAETRGGASGTGEQADGHSASTASRPFDEGPAASPRALNARAEAESEPKAAAPGSAAVASPGMPTVTAAPAMPVMPTMPAMPTVAGTAASSASNASNAANASNVFNASSASNPPNASSASGASGAVGTCEPDPQAATAAHGNAADDTPPPAAAPAAGDAEELAIGPDAPSGWIAVVERVRRQKPAVASVLEHGHVVTFNHDAVEIAYPARTFYWEAAHEEEMRQLLAGALADELGCKVPVKVVPLATAAQPAASLAQMAAARRRARENEIRAAALAHPAVRGAMSILDGEVAQVIPLVRELDESA